MEEQDRRNDLRAPETDPTIDGSTGLYTLRYFDRQLEIELKRAERYLHPLSLILAEIDGRESGLGWEAGLQGGSILSRAGALLKSSTRETNLVSRYGGKGFSILLPETPGRLAAKTAVRLRRIIQKEPLLSDPALPGKALTVSVGIASFPWDASDAEELIHHAGEALRQAKRLGGNRVYWYGISGFTFRLPVDSKGAA